MNSLFANSDFIVDFPVKFQKHLCNALELDNMHASLPGLNYKPLHFYASSS